MEDTRIFRPKLDQEGEFWRAIHTISFQTLAKVQWNSSESHWNIQSCKFHTLQAVFRGALAELNASVELPDLMKRGPEATNPELYAFNTDVALKYQLTPGERQFLRKLNLEEFVASNPWGVLHSALVTEAIASVDPKTWVTTVKGEAVALLSKNWRKQFQRVFHLARKEATSVTKVWQLVDLFPKIKDTSKETVRISECKHPVARRPLRLLSTFFCLNSTHQSHITVAFIEVVLAAMNGEEVDWPQEFHNQLTVEILSLHKKHTAPKVKMEKTSIGPHVTIILREAGIFDIREEMEAGYRSSKALTLEEQLPHPKTKRSKGTREQPSSSTQVDPPPPTEAKSPVTEVYSVAPQVTNPNKTTKVGVVIENSKAWKPPNPLPTMVEQICQVHRRLENLLTAFTSKAPKRFVEQMNEEFFRIQRQADLQQHSTNPTHDTSEAILKAQELQLKHLTRQLANSDSLNEINLETIFVLEEESHTMRDTLEQAQNEVQSLKSQKGEAEERLKRLQENIDVQHQISQTKQKELDRLDRRITDMKNVARRQDDLISRHKEEKLRMEATIAQHQQEIATITTENQNLREKLTTQAEDTATCKRKEAPTSPVSSKEKHTLAAGVATKLLNELRRDLSIAQQENQQLKHQLTNMQFKPEEVVIAQSAIHPKAEIYHQIISHTAPPQSVMQCHRAYGGLNLLLGGVSLLQAGCNLELIQVKQIWDRADATTKDTIAFMWCLGEIKLPHGVMEVISGCPPFYIKRYVLRCIKLLAQYPPQPEILKEPLPTLRSYSHGQYHLIKNLQRSQAKCFQQALNTLAEEDMTICYEAVRVYQDMASKHLYPNLSPTPNQIKQFASKTFEEQQATLSSHRFGTINSGTLLMIPHTHQKPQVEPIESIGTCFL